MPSLDSRYLLRAATLLASVVATCPSSPADTIEFVEPDGDFRSASASWVSGDAPYYFTSGSVAAPADPTLKPDDEKRYLPTLEGQARSALATLSFNLAQAGLTARDVAFLRAYVVTGTPPKIDTSGFWTAYESWFGTPENPARPPVSIVPVPKLARHGLLLEIEWVAAGPAGVALTPMLGVDTVVTNPSVTTLARAGSLIAQGKLLRPQTSLYFASGNIAAPANPTDPIPTWRIEGTVYEQASSALARIETGLEARGLSFGDVVFLRCFLVDDIAETPAEESAFFQWNKAFGEHFNCAPNPNRPSRTTVLVPAFDIAGMRLEIEVIAAYPDSSGPFVAAESKQENTNLIAYGPPNFPIAEGKAVARRSPLLWSGTILPRNTGASVTEQASDVLQQATALLAEKELDPADIVFLRVYGVPGEDSGKIDRPAWHVAYSKVFGTEKQPVKPARTFLPVPALEVDGARIAIDFVAAGRG